MISAARKRYEGELAYARKLERKSINLPSKAPVTGMLKRARQLRAEAESEFK